MKGYIKNSRQITIPSQYIRSLPKNFIKANLPPLSAVGLTVTADVILPEDVFKVLVTFSDVF